jgi:hypothetical protein
MIAMGISMALYRKVLCLNATLSAVKPAALIPE